MEGYAVAYCRNCGKEIDDNAKFCRYCGNKVGVISNNSTPEPDETTKTAVEVVGNENVGVENIQNISVVPDGGAVLKKKKSKAPLIIVVIVVVLAGLFAAFWFLLKPILFKNNDVIPKNLFNDGLLSAMSEQGGKWGYIDEKGNFVIEAQFDAVTEFSDGYATVSVDGKWGVIDTKGKYSVSPQYDYISRFSNGVAVVTDFDVDDEGSDKCGLIDTKGKMLLPITYDKIGSDSCRGLGELDLDDDVDIFPIKSGEKYGYANTKGEIIVNPTYDDANSFSEGYAAVCSNEKYGFIDGKGKLVINCQYDNAYSFSEGFSVVQIGEKYGAINNKVEYVVNPKYDDLCSFSEGYAVFSSNEKYGFVDAKGKEVIKAQYDYCGSFKNGVASAEKSGEWGLIDTSEKWIIPAKYEDLRRINNTIYAVSKDGKWGLVNKKGKEILKPTYDSISGSTNYDKRCSFSYGGKMGYLSENGDVCISNSYISGSEFYSDGYAIVTTDDKKAAIINTSGGIVNNKKYYGLAGEMLRYCQYDGCFNTVSISDSDKYCSQEIARKIYRDVNSGIADMIVNGETITGDVPYSNLVVKMVDCSDTNVTDKLSKCVVDSCNGGWNDQKTKGYAIVLYFKDSEECAVFWAHDKSEDKNVGVSDDSLYENSQGSSLNELYSILTNLADSY